MQMLQADVAIIGGGLAGLCLAKQLRDVDANLEIAIIERNAFPVPNTTAKVGESTVELASHYLTDVLGLREHFTERHLDKNGLRCFFGSPQADFAQQDELGTSALFGLPTYQLERGVLENHLFELLSDQGVKILHGALLEQISLGDKDHQLVVQTAPEAVVTVACTWVVDAAGRASVLKNELGLSAPIEHAGHAVWFRVDRRIVLDEWSDDADWQARLCCPGKRWLSTNHLMGPGYWVWVIPLGSGATSIGIVMDDQAFAESGIDDYAQAIAWLEREQPRCAQALAGATVLDFMKVTDFTLGVKKVFSDQGWALTGEAGFFADPFYSPGSDFIAISNTFITDLIQADRAGEDIRLKSLVYQRSYEEIFKSTLSLYQNQYGGFGDRQMMSVKLVWDYAYYWGVLTLLFFRRALTNIDLMRQLAPTLNQVRALNQKMQASFAQRAQARQVLLARGEFMNQYTVPCLHQVTAVLNKPLDSCVTKDLSNNAVLLSELSEILLPLLMGNPSAGVSPVEQRLLGDYRCCVLA